MNPRGLGFVVRKLLRIRKEERKKKGKNIYKILGCPKKVKVENVLLHRTFLVQNFMRIPKIPLFFM